MMSSLKNNFINEIIDLLIDEVSKEETTKKINTYIIEPSFTYLFDRLYPYLVLTLIIFVLILLMAIVIIIILIRNYRYSM
jgi:hypothetical protein